GTGIFLPDTLIKDCIQRDLFDDNIPHYFITRRTFTVQNGRKIWLQELKGEALSWTDVQYNLQKRVPEDTFVRTEVIDIKQDEKLNWLLYEKCHFQDEYKNHLTETQRNHLNQKACEVLPKEFAEIVKNTQHPFLQNICEAEVSTMCDKRIIFLGDAAFVLRPH